MNSIIKENANMSTKIKPTTRSKAKPKGNRKINPASKPLPRSRHNPYRKDSLYAAIFDCLIKFKAKGISRSALVEKVTGATGKDPKNVYFGCSVVCSPDGFGKSHRSAKPDTYFVEKQNSHLKLILIEDNNA